VSKLNKEELLEALIDTFALSVTNLESLRYDIPPAELGERKERLQQACRQIEARLEELDEIRAITIDPHLTQDQTMRDLLKLVKSDNG
jgi:hypothetical protein